MGVQRPRTHLQVREKWPGCKTIVFEFGCQLESPDEALKILIWGVSPQTSVIRILRGVGPMHEQF